MKKRPQQEVLQVPKAPQQKCRCRPAKRYRDCAHCGVGWDDGRICGVCKAGGVDGNIIPGTGRVICARHKED